MTEPAVLVRVVQTSIACPSQWDAWDADGNYYYLRYRHGYGSVRRYETADWADADDDQFLGHVADFEHGDDLDGDISLEDFARLAGITLAPDAVFTGFGDHVRDELVTEHGMTFLLEDKEPGS